MTASHGLALRPGNCAWEDELWTRQLVRAALTGQPPDLPVDLTANQWAEVIAAVSIELAMIWEDQP